MIGKVFIEHLVVRTHIGVTAEERASKQDVVLDISLWFDISDAAKADNLENTISYSDLGKKVLRYTETSSFNLLEALANAIADICLEDKKVEKVEVTVAKPHIIPSAKSAGVTLIKDRQDK